jgi:hypothetical protein
MTDLVRIRAAYERTPTGIKGALVLRGADGQPHQLRLEGASVLEWTGKGSERIAVEQAVIEVAPTLDTFVPFEVSTLDLDPGWYRIRCDVVVDAVGAVVEPGPRFVVAWPRGTIRRGTVAIDASVGGVALRGLECAGDSIRVGFASDEPPEVVLSVDGAAHPVLEVEHGEGGKGRIVGYPVRRDQRSLSIELAGAGPLEVALP